MQCAIGERGQITIPKSARKAMGLEPGMRLEVSVEHGTLVFRKPGIEDALNVWEGTAENPYGSIDAYIAALRDADQDLARAPE